MCWEEKNIYGDLKYTGEDAGCADAHIWVGGDFPTMEFSVCAGDIDMDLEQLKDLAKIMVREFEGQVARVKEAHHTIEKQRRKELISNVKWQCRGGMKWHAFVDGSKQSVCKRETFHACRLTSPTPPPKNGCKTCSKRLGLK